MKHSANSAAALIVIGSLVSGCSFDRDKEIREFGELERALAAVATAPAEDRVIRLKEADNVKVSTERVAMVKRLCVEAYKFFIEANDMLSRAKTDIDAAESSVIEVRKRKSDGGSLSPEEEAKLMKMSESAAASVGQVNQMLDRAENAVRECQNSRIALRKDLL